MSTVYTSPDGCVQRDSTPCHKAQIISNWFLEHDNGPHLLICAWKCSYPVEKLSFHVKSLLDSRNVHTGQFCSYHNPYVRKSDSFQIHGLVFPASNLTAYCQTPISLYKETILAQGKVEKAGMML